jgi:hypothetical protein
MRSHRASRVTVAIWTCLSACLRYLAVRPGVRSGGWRLHFRVTAVGVAAVLLTAGLAAAPARAASATPARAASATPARAASATPAGGAISVPSLAGPAAAGAAEGHAAITTAATALPAQLQTSFDFQSYPPAEATAAVDNWWPEMLGLPDNSSLGQLLSATWTLWQNAAPPSDWLPPQPTDFSGASISVASDGGTGSILTFTVPTPSGGTVTTSGLTTTEVAILAHMIGGTSALGAIMLCGAYFFGLPTGSNWVPDYSNARPWAQRGCGAVATGAWTLGATAFSDAMADKVAPSSGFPWKTLLTAVGFSAIVGYGNNTFAAPLIRAFQYGWIGLASWVGASVPGAVPVVGTLIDLLTPYVAPPELQYGAEFVRSLYSGTYDSITRSVDEAALELGLWSPITSGYVGNVPSGGAVTVGSGQCMDAYGSNVGNEPAAPPAVPGQSVAINVCNGNPAQNFTFWPNGQITIYGLCLDDDGDSNSSDTPVVNLQMCNGGYTQQWWESTVSHFVNVATDNCLDDPGGNTTPGTQLIVSSCNPHAEQVWSPPGGTAAISRFGPMTSVADADGSCVYPQVTLANPVGSDVQLNTAWYCSRLLRGWALGANGTLMANGTNALCMDSDGPATTGPGGEAAYLVQLQYCDGSQSQVWNVVSTYLGPTWQNAADGLCLNTPGGGVYPKDASMVVASCASVPYPGELWTLPGVPVETGSSSGPCDILGSAGTPCVAAYSTTRALFGSYFGPLYQVTRASDGATANIGLLSEGGDVDAAQQDSFCSDTTCTITEIYDQSSEGNNLAIEGAGGNGGQDKGADAFALPVMIGGNKAYGLDITPGTGYRDDGPGNAGASGVATHGAPEGTYMVASGTNVNSGCCFDFGNAESDNKDDGAGRMDALNLTTYCGNNNASPCSGPWVEADMENGQWTGSGPNAETASNSDFVTAVLNNDGQHNFELEGGNSQSGGLSTFYDGALPSGYSPMNQEGGIVLGTGGDNSHSDYGSFFEGVMTAGFPSAAADAAVQANIVAADYAGNSGTAGGGGGGGGGGLAPPAGTITMAGGNCVDVAGNDTGTSGTPVDSWACQSTAVDQHWTHNANGSLETLGQCLDVSTAIGVGGSGTAVAGDHTTLWGCNGSGVEQWEQQPDGLLVNPPSGLCLYGQPANGYQLQVVNCNASDPDQQFSVNGGSPITNPASGKCVDVAGNDTGTDGTPIDMWACQAGAVDQHWKYNPATMELSTLGRCLGVSTAVGVGGTGTALPGEHTTLWDCNGSGVEQWVEQPDGTLLNPLSTLCLYGQPTNGWQLQVVDCNASDPDQQFSVYAGATASGTGVAAPAGTITGTDGDCVDVMGNDDGDMGTVVDQWPCQSTAVDQHWTHNADGTLETLGRCLNISTALGVGGVGTALPGDHTTLWDCNDSGVEQWAEQPNGTLINPPSGLCLDDSDGNTSSGWQLQVWTCTNGDPNEQFSVNGGSPIIDQASGQCIDVAGNDNGTDGTPVDLWGCQQGAADQHWFYNSSNNTLGTLGRCLGVSTAIGVGGTGTAVVGDHTTLWDCNGSGVEQWVPQSDGTLVNPPSGLCLDDPNGNTSNGTQLQVFGCTSGDSNQQFGVFDTGRMMINPLSGMCVDVAGNNNGVDGTPVDLWGCQPTATDQHWKLTSTEELETLGRCLGVSTAAGVGGSGTAVAGDHITLWDCNGSGVEQWVPTSSGTWENPPSNLCLYDPNESSTGSTPNGTQLEVSNCQQSAGYTVLFNWRNS